jgi:hypothetical protein
MCTICLQTVCVPYACKLYVYHMLANCMCTVCLQTVCVPYACKLYAYRMLANCMRTICLQTVCVPYACKLYVYHMLANCMCTVCLQTQLLLLDGNKVCPSVGFEFCRKRGKENLLQSIMLQVPATDKDGMAPKIMASVLNVFDWTFLHFIVWPIMSVLKLWCRDFLIY